MDETTIERFWSKVNKAGPIPSLAPELGECWLWVSAPDNTGGGKFWSNNATHRAHRFSWELAGHAAPEGQLIHVCGVPLCVRPSHLSDSLADRRKKIVRPGRRRQVARECRACGVPFTVKASLALRGYGLFCTAECFRTWDNLVSADATFAARRFWSRVNKSGPTVTHVSGISACWLWTGALTPFGYGSFWYSRRNVHAHRFAFALVNSVDLSSDEHVCHECDVRRCVNPAHLFLGDWIINNADRDAKGRQAKGAVVGTARMDDAVASRIFELRSYGLTQTAIGELVGMSNQTVSNVLGGRSWRHVVR